MATNPLEEAPVQTVRRTDIETEILNELNDHQMEVWDTLSKIKASTESHAMLDLMLKYISNIVNDPSNPTYHEIRVSNKTFQKKIGATAHKEQAFDLFRLAGFKPQRVEFKQDTNASIPPTIEEYLVRDEPRTLSELSEISNVWFLLQVKLWFDTNSTDKSKPFKLPDTLSSAMGAFLQEVSVNLVRSGVVTSMKESGFQHYLNESIKAGDAHSRYEHFAKALTMTPQFFSPNNIGLDDFFTSWLCCKFIFNSYFSNENDPTTTKTNNKKEEEKDEKEEEKDEKVEDIINEESKDERQEIRILDIGCGWGNIGRGLSAHFRSKIDKSQWNKMHLYGLDISEQMIELGKKQGFGNSYKEMYVWDCKNERLRMFEDNSIDCIVSANCLLQDAEIGHPNEDFLKECKRLLRLNGKIFVARRKLIYNNNFKPWRQKAFELNLSEVQFGRVRESIYIEWQKII